MKQSTKFCISTGIILIVVGILLSAAGILMGGLSDIRNYRPENLQAQELELSADTVHHVEIMTDSEDVTVLPSDGNSLKIIYADSETETHSHELTASAVDGKQICTFYTHHTAGFSGNVQFGFVSAETHITVYLPEGMGLSVHSGSGDVEIFDVAAGNVVITTASGDTDAKDLTALRFELTTTSGETDLENVTCNDLSAASVSGDTEVETSLIQGSLSLLSTSGDITLQGSTVSGNINLNSTSGEISVTVCIAEGDIHANSDSGDVALFLVSVDDHFIKTDTSSGIVDVAGGSRTATNVIAVTTSSGDIQVGDSHGHNRQHD